MNLPIKKDQISDPVGQGFLAETPFSVYLTPIR